MRSKIVILYYISIFTVVAVLKNIYLLNSKV
eukprot:UN08455